MEAIRVDVIENYTRDVKVIMPWFSLNRISNLSNISNLPSKRGTSSIKARANLIFNFLSLRKILMVFKIYGTPAPDTPFISKILSSGDCFRPNALPSPKETIVMSAPESIYMAASTLRCWYSRITFATGLNTVPVIMEGSFRYLNLIIRQGLIYLEFLRRTAFF